MASKMAAPSSTYPKRYVMGYKIDRIKMAHVLEINDVNSVQLAEDSSYVVEAINRDAYKYLQAVYDGDDPEHAPEGRNGQTISLVFVLEDSYDREELEEKKRVAEATPPHPAIAWAQPHVLTGPGIWEAH